MFIHTEDLTLASSAPIEIIDITALVRERLAASGLRAGLLTLVSRHTTACLNINEQERQLQRDMVTFLKRLAPRDGDYRHNIAPVDDRDNAHAHLLGLLMSASVSIPVAEGVLQLGEWQSILFIELDGPRPTRRVTLQCLGDRDEDED